MKVNDEWKRLSNNYTIKSLISTEWSKKQHFFHNFKD